MKPSDVNVPQSPTEFLLSLREELRFDAQGRWWHDGALVEHAGVAEFFSRHARWSETHQAFVISNGPANVPYVYEDTPFLIVSIDCDQLPWTIELSNGHREPLRVETLSVEDSNLWYARALENSVRVRLSRNTTLALWPLVEETAPGVYGLRYGAELLPLGTGQEP